MSKSTIISELDMNFGELHEIKNQEDRYDTFIRVLSKNHEKTKIFSKKLNFIKGLIYAILI